MTTIAKAAAAILCLALAGPFAGGSADARSSRTAWQQATAAEVLADARAPIGWTEFCTTHVTECDTEASKPAPLALDAKSWRLLLTINNRVNRAIEPVSDADHWGVAERWSYPDDGRGDCEDFVLLKRAMLIEAGVPRSALLVTVVRDDRNDGHAVLTVVTTEGDFVLDNKRDAVLPWQRTGYRFYKRQSQEHPNRWVSIGGGNATMTASSRP